jgi:hypothetical protein
MSCLEVGANMPFRFLRKDLKKAKYGSTSCSNGHKDALATEATTIHYTEVVYLLS